MWASSIGMIPVFFMILSAELLLHNSAVHTSKQFHTDDYVDGDRVSGTGQEFQKSRWREKFEQRSLEIKSPCSEKRHLQKGAVNLNLKYPESEADYHLRGQKIIKDVN